VSAMKVIKEPSKKENAYQLSCRTCEAVFECTKQEMKQINDFRYGLAFVLVCTFCKSESWYYVNVMSKFMVR